MYLDDILGTLPTIKLNWRIPIHMTVTTGYRQKYKCINECAMKNVMV